MAERRASRFRRQSAYLVASTIYVTDARLCRQCARALGRSCQNSTLWKGWWGIFAVFRNVSIVWGNARSLQRAGHLLLDGRDPAVVTPLQQPMAAGRSVFTRSGALVAAALIAVVSSLVYVNVAKPQASWTVGECVTGITYVSPVHCSETHRGRIVAVVSTPAQCPTESGSYVDHDGKVYCINTRA
jgi:hypothetical protein